MQVVSVKKRVRGENVEVEVDGVDEVGVEEEVGVGDENSLMATLPRQRSRCSRWYGMVDWAGAHSRAYVLHILAKGFVGS